jgi:hypothetical protein
MDTVFHFNGDNEPQTEYGLNIYQSTIYENYAPLPLPGPLIKRHGRCVDWSIIIFCVVPTSRHRYGIWFPPLFPRLMGGKCDAILALHMQCFFGGYGCLPLNKENPGMNRQDLSYRGFLGESMTFGRLNEHTHPLIYTNNVPHLSNFGKFNHFLTRTAKAFYL